MAYDQRRSVQIHHSGGYGEFGFSPAAVPHNDSKSSGPSVRDRHFGDSLYEEIKLPDGSIDYRIKLERTLQKKVILDGIRARILLDEEYDINTGLFDHNLSDDFNPLKVVSFLQGEDTDKDSPMFNYFKRYRINNIQKYFGISLTEFLNYPTDIAEELLRQAREATAEQNEKAEAMLREMEQDQD